MVNPKLLRVKLKFKCFYGKYIVIQFYCQNWSKDWFYLTTPKRLFNAGQMVLDVIYRIKFTFGQINYETFEKSRTSHCKANSNTFNRKLDVQI